MSEQKFEQQTTSEEFIKQLHSMIDFFINPSDEVLSGSANMKFDEDFNKIINIKLKVGLKFKGMRRILEERIKK